MPVPSIKRAPLYRERACTLVGGVVLMMTALLVFEVGLLVCVPSDTALIRLSGLCYMLFAAIALGAAGSAIWARGFRFAALGPVPLALVLASDVGMRASLGEPTFFWDILGLVLVCTSLVLVVRGRAVFGPLLPGKENRFWQWGSEPPSKGRPGGMGMWLARPLSLLGAGVLMTLSVGAIIGGILDYRLFPTSEGNGVLLVLGGVLGILSSALAVIGRGFPFVVAAPIMLMALGLWTTYMSRVDSTALKVAGLFSLQLGLLSYTLLALSFPFFTCTLEEFARTRAVYRRRRPLSRTRATILGSTSSELRLYSVAEDLALGIDPETGRPQPRTVEEPPILTPRTPIDVRPVEYIIEEVFVVYRDGRLISTVARGGRRTEDADLMSGMLIAIQGIIQEALQKGSKLESIRYGESSIHLSSGNHVVIAAVVFGEAGPDLRHELHDYVRRIEGAYAGVIEAWTGDLSQLSGIEDLIVQLIQGTAHIRREVVRGAQAPMVVQLLSVVDFHRGYVRLKVAVVNGTPELIADASVEVDYEQEMLRLEMVEPGGLQLRGDRVHLGNIHPGDRKSVAFLFDPQVCSQTHIHGSLTFYNARGVRQRVEMKKRMAEVVCPIFFTPDQANTAMLKDLIRGTMNIDDIRVFRYSDRLEPHDVLAIAKGPLARSGVQLVREFIVEGPPYQAEVWYYGETKAGAVKMIMRLSVIDEGRYVALYVSSTQVEPLTGLLAEFRRDLERAFFAAHGVDGRLEQVRGDVVRKRLRSTSFLSERR